MGSSVFASAVKSRDKLLLIPVPWYAPISILPLVSRALLEDAPHRRLEIGVPNGQAPATHPVKHNLFRRRSGLAVEVVELGGDGRRHIGRSGRLDRLGGV